MITASASICSATPPEAVTAPVLTIDVGAVVANWRRLAAMHAGETAAVVKADAYGLGAALVAPALASAGCERFFVATADEGVALRGVVPGAWIAVLNGCPPGFEPAFVAYRLTPVLNTLDDVARWQAAGRTVGRTVGRALPALLQIDTGMSRLGLDAAELICLVSEPERLDGIDLVYIMSHLCAAEQADAPDNRAQAARFAETAACFPGIKTSLANSSGMFLDTIAVSDLARPGIALYGGNPTPGRPNPMRAVVGLSAPVLQIR